MRTGSRRLRAGESSARALSPGELAWIAALPCAIAIVAAIVVLGPSIGHALPGPAPDETLWPAGVPYVFGGPEPVKHARFAIALLGPALLAVVILAASRRRVRLGPTAARALPLASQTLMLAFLVAAVIGQDGTVLPLERELELAEGRWPLRTEAYAAAPVLVGALLAAMRSRRVAGLLARWAQDTRPRRIAYLALAAALTACWLLTAINTEASIGNAAFSDLPPWVMGDTFAILDGRTPLVNFYALYGEVWAYVAAVPLSIFGATVTAFSIVMTSISGLSLLAVYGILRRIVRSSLLALLLYLPVLATGFLVVPSIPERAPSNAQIFSVWPMRYAGPYLLAWLTARHIDRAAPRRVATLFLVAGLVLLNNLEFGIGAVGGTLVALLCTELPRSWRAAGRLGAEVAGGLLGALLLVALVTLAHSGQLPQLGFLLEYPRIFGTAGYTALPMRTAGFHLVVYATFAAAIATAAVRVARGAADVLLTGMLAWSGIFGLLAGSYFAGRSDVFKLLAVFSAWAFALALLAVLVVRALAARDWRRPSLAELMVLYGIALAAVSVRELPAPWSQIARLHDTTRTPLYRQAAARSFLAAHTAPGDRVAILIAMGHRLARGLQLVNVAPYALMEAILTQSQLHKTIDAIHREGAHELFVESRLLAPEHRAVLAQAGFSPRAIRSGLAEWSDAEGGAR